MSIGLVRVWLGLLGRSRDGRVITTSPSKFVDDWSAPESRRYRCIGDQHRKDRVASSPGSTNREDRVKGRERTPLGRVPGRFPDRGLANGRGTPWKASWPVSWSPLRAFRKGSCGFPWCGSGNRSWPVLGPVSGRFRAGLLVVGQIPSRDTLQTPVCRAGLLARCAPLGLVRAVSRAGPLGPFLAHSERSSGRSVGPVPGSIPQARQAFPVRIRH